MSNFPPGVTGNEPEIAGDALYEQVQEQLDADCLGYLYESGTSCVDFINYLDTVLPKGEVEKYLSMWLKTKDGQEWYEQKLAYLYRKLLDEGPEHDD